MVKRLIILGVVAVALAACEAADAPADATPPSTPAPTGFEAQFATIGNDRIPLPGRAVPHETSENGWTVPGMQLADVVAWYQREMPVGEPFGDWAWCEYHDGDLIKQRIYHRDGTPQLLFVILTADSPPGILIGRDGSGPC
jgi:hypothetical protein